jgi:hypothetical protein
MKSLNYQDFINAYKALDNAKYPNLGDSSAHYLLGTLVAHINCELTFEEIQKRIDESTQEKINELEKFLTEQVGA